MWVGGREGGREGRRGGGERKRGMFSIVIMAFGVVRYNQHIILFLRKLRDNYRIALYFRGPKLSLLEHAKQFHEIIFTISGMALTSYRVLQLQHLSCIRVGSRYG